MQEPPRWVTELIAKDLKIENPVSKLAIQTWIKMFCMVLSTAVLFGEPVPSSGKLKLPLHYWVDCRIWVARLGYGYWEADSWLGLETCRTYLPGAALAPECHFFDGVLALHCLAIWFSLYKITVAKSWGCLDSGNAWLVFKENAYQRIVLGMVLIATSRILLSNRGNFNIELDDHKNDVVYTRRMA